MSRTQFKDQIYGFLDNDQKKQGTKLFGLPVISPFSLTNELKKSLFIISALDGVGMHHELMGFGISPQNVFWPPFGRLVAQLGHQYFDVFSADSNEVFMDVGCYDAGTSAAFAKWCNDDYEKIYAFEGSKNRADVCRDNAKKHGLRNFELIEKACSEEPGVVNFVCDNNSEVFGQARISDESEVKVPADSIDNVLRGNRVTFIKMDIEGGELSALKGAKESIKKWRPKLAISLYHKFEDIIELPAYIVSLIDDYKLYIRHYNSDSWETVLYAM